MATRSRDRARTPIHLGMGDNAVILIELSGAIAPPGSSGLSIHADLSGVRGLVINQFQADAIDIDFCQRRRN